MKTGLSPISNYETKSDSSKSLEKVYHATVDSPSLQVITLYRATIVHMLNPCVSKIFLDYALDNFSEMPLEFI